MKFFTLPTQRLEKMYIMMIINKIVCAFVSKDIKLPYKCVTFFVHHLVQTAHENSLVLSYGGQGSDPHLPSTK